MHMNVRFGAYGGANGPKVHGRDRLIPDLADPCAHLAIFHDYIVVFDVRVVAGNRAED